MPILIKKKTFDSFDIDTDITFITKDINFLFDKTTDTSKALSKI